MENAIHPLQLYQAAEKTEHNKNVTTKVTIYLYMTTF